jgi:Spy/CpxP family protein refolding chaperone
MKTLKRSLKIGALMLVMSASIMSVSAQKGAGKTPMTKEQKAERKEDRKEKAMEMKKALNLTEAQAAQIKNIRREARTEMDALRGNTAMPKEQMKAERKRIRTDERNKIMNILTPEQKEKFKAMKEEKMENEHQEKIEQSTPPTLK